MSDVRQKQINELTPADLEACPIWEFTGVEKATRPNEGQVRPRPDLELDDSQVEFELVAVRTKFHLADGTTLPGYCVPTSRLPEDPHFLGYLQPAIVSDAGHVPFWLSLDQPPRRQDIDAYYGILGRGADGVFPVAFEVDVPVAADEVTSGVIRGFSGLVYDGSTFAEFELR